MSTKARLISKISLKGLEIAPSQVWGSIRLVPLLRQNQNNNLRLFRRSYDEDIGIVNIDKKLNYISYIPHGLVLSWNDRETPQATLGSQLASDGKSLELKCCRGNVKLRMLNRMAKKESPNQLRFLPLHLAMEGFLSMYFSGPSITWNDYPRRILSKGLNPRSEYSFSGSSISGFEDALRVFEIHENQVGILVFVAEALASAFIVPNSQDYRALHTSLLQDFYGELIYYYGMLRNTNYPMDVSVDESKINSIKELREAISKMRRDWAEFQGFMADSLLDRPLQAKRIQKTGIFTLERFITDLDPQEVNHIGEVIVSQNGDLEYLKSYRLSTSQTKRIYLLSQLAKYDWNLENTAISLNISQNELVKRLERVGFGYLLKESVLNAAKKNKL